MNPAFLLRLGQMTRSGGQIVTLKKRNNETLSPGDLVRIKATGSDQATRALKVINKNDFVFGIVTQGLFDSVSVLIKGYIVASIDEAIFNIIKIGEYLNSPKRRDVLILRTLNATDSGLNIKKAYEVRMT